MVLIACAVELVEGVECYGHGIAGMGGRETIFEGGRARHSDASKRRGQRTREAQHVLDKTGEEDTGCEHVDGPAMESMPADRLLALDGTYARPMLV